MQEHDTGIITAFRKKELSKDDDKTIVKVYTKKENNHRNIKVEMKLGRKYTLTRVKGGFIENFGSDLEADEVTEESFFVVDKNEYGGLEKDLKRLGQEFNQDSIMFIPKGSKKGILWGTKNDEFSCIYAYPEFGHKIEYPNAVWGNSSEFVTRIKGRPFYFKEGAELQLEEIEKPGGYGQNLSYHLSAKESGIECKKEIV